MEELNPKVIMGLLSVALIGGISLAAKETISNLWAALSFILSPRLRKGKVIQVKVQGELLEGAIKSFSLSRIVIEDKEGNLHLVLVSDLKGTTITVLK